MTIRCFVSSLWHIFFLIDKTRRKTKKNITPQEQSLAKNNFYKKEKSNPTGKMLNISVVYQTYTHHKFDYTEILGRGVYDNIIVVLFYLETISWLGRLTVLWLSHSSSSLFSNIVRWWCTSMDCALTKHKQWMLRCCCCCCCCCCTSDTAGTATLRLATLLI